MSTQGFKSEYHNSNEKSFASRATAANTPFL